MHTTRPAASCTKTYELLPLGKMPEARLGGHQVKQEGSSKSFNFVFILLGICGLVIFFAGALTWGLIQTKTESIFMVTLGSSVGLVSSVLALVKRKEQKECGVSNDDSTVIVLINKDKKVTTTVGELYQIAEGTENGSDPAFLKEVRACLDSKDFQTNPLLYTESWIEHRNKNSSMDQKALEFFCYLFQEVLDPRFPWKEPG